MKNTIFQTGSFALSRKKQSGNLVRDIQPRLPIAVKTSGLVRKDGFNND